VVNESTEVVMGLTVHLIAIDGPIPPVRHDLKPGRLRLGRAADNDVVLDDGSVSQHHCEVEWSGDEVRVRDLGSLNGTWIDGVQVNEGALEPGQSLHVGAIQFILQTATGRERSLSAVDPRLASGEVDGQIEAAIPAGWLHCPRCAKWHAPESTKERRLGTTILRFCPQCGGPCTGSLPAINRADERREMTFWEGVRGAFSYPWRGSGSTVLLAGAVALTVADYAALFAAFAFLLGLIALVFLFIGVGG
jgi:pSer/pThr/pTyr-binding forkhead associated (FHA) protein